MTIFVSEMTFFGLEWSITSYGQKHFEEINHHLCKVSNA